MPERPVLMNPGPVLVDERVRRALAGPEMCHREPEFYELMTRVREKTTRLCAGDESYAAVIFTGSGTAALEATLCSVVPPGGRLLILDNGHYGDRLATIAAVHHVPLQHRARGWAVPFDLDGLEEVLRRDRSLTHVAMVHHETSTGMLNPLHQVGEIVGRYNRSLIVDAISSVGGELLDVRTDHIDWCVGTANKCIEGAPGLSFVCAPRASLDRLAGVPASSFYLNLYSQYVAQDRRKAPAFTPAVPAFRAFDTALDLTLEEGVAGRNARYASLARQLRGGLSALEFTFLLPPPYRSNSLTAVHLPAGIGYGELHDRLKAHGFVIYASQEALQKKVFRVANMGQITHGDIARFLCALEQVVRDLAGGDRARP